MIVLSGFWYLILKNSNSQKQNEDLGNQIDLFAKSEKQRQCELDNGEWVFRGESSFCNLPASDFGRSCMDSDECEGDCMGNIGELTTEEIKKINTNQLMDRSGQCSSYKLQLGCNVILKNGRWVEICVD